MTISPDQAAGYVVVIAILGILGGLASFALLGKSPSEAVQQVTQDVAQTTSVSATRRVIVFGMVILVCLCALGYAALISAGELVTP